MVPSCHPERKHKAFGLCDPCYKRTPENRIKNRERLQRWRAANPDLNARYQRKYLYGLSDTEYQALLEAQDSKCRLCDRSVKLVVDHDHLTGKVRGLLCIRCNRDLAAVEREGWLDRVLTYLDRDQQPQSG